MWKGCTTLNPKLSSTVSVVKINDSIVEFFKSNTREQVRVKGDSDSIIEITSELDGNKTVEELAKHFNLEITSLQKLLSFLEKKGILDLTRPVTDFENYRSFRRTVNFLNDFSDSHADLVNSFKNITTKTVMVIGLGAVGSWVVANLAQSGVRNFILIDPDKVDVTNLHRQFGYYDSDIGKYKVDALEKRLREYTSDIKLEKYREYLSTDTLNKFNGRKIDLIINCADKPNVDTTSKWVGEFCMKNNIPHIVGGGYNLHLSLVGQTIIPNKSACIKCFEKTLSEENNIDDQDIKKLVIKNRKIGSIGPMCTIIASLIGMEAIKVLSEKILPANLNRRGEFDVYSMGIKFSTFAKRDDCEWCGMSGKYRH